MDASEAGLASDLARVLRGGPGADGGDFRRCQIRARLNREDYTDAGRRRARSLIALFRVQGILQDMTTEELIERILSWRPPLQDLTHAAVEREVARAIFAREPGTEDMVCPERWRESLEAGADLLARYEAIPDRELAEWWADIPSDYRDERAIKGWYDELATRYGITDELCRRAMGSDADEIDEDEAALRIGEYLTPILEGKKAWRVLHLMRHAEEQEQEDRSPHIKRRH